MKHFILICISVLFPGACLAAPSAEVRFEYFNLSTNMIKVINIVGLPRVATPGALAPSRVEDELKVAASVFYEIVPVADLIRIIWKENGSSHELELKRNDLGIPAKLKNGKVRFTYLGEGKWRVKLIKT